MVDAKSLLVTAAYGTIREMVDRFVGKMGSVAGVSLTDLVLFAIGYYKKNTWWGVGLMYGAVAQIGANIFRLGVVAGAQQTTAPAKQTFMTGDRYIIW
jgi:hypothetical protein